MDPFFTGDSYHTSNATPRALLDRLGGDTRILFMLNYFSIVLRSRSAALKGRYKTEEWARSSFDVLRLIEKSGGRIHITGLKNLSKAQKPAVFVSNHMSTLETMVFPCIIAPLTEVTFVVKESLVKHPFFGPVMRSRDPIVINRSNPREDFKEVMEKGRELLSRGTSIVIFPQSTRTVDFSPKEFNTIGVKLARSAEVPVVPIAIKTDFWGNGKRLKDLGPIDRSKPIRMAFGEPLSIKGTGKEEHDFIIRYINEHLARWKAEEIRG